MVKRKIDIKETVKEKYGLIANQSKSQNSSSCCGSGSCCDADYSIFSDDYRKLKGYNPDADLGLGCGLPTEFANIKPGNTVVDLGSGAGNDCFVARAEVGETGKVIGIDFTDEMIEKARANVRKLGLSNVEFLKSDIENMKLSANLADVVVSNCVLNLVPDKKKAFSEIYRILKPGGHFSISDIVLRGSLPDEIKYAAEMYAGCVSGALQIEEYMQHIKNMGFMNIMIQKEKTIDIPDQILEKYLPGKEFINFKDSHVGIYSITVYAEKSI